MSINTTRNFIYIIGWARGGTTLAKNLFCCFEDTWVAPGPERDTYKDVPFEVKASNIVIKLHFDSQDLDSLQRLYKRGNGKLLFLIRDPRDTVVSNCETNPIPGSYIDTQSGESLYNNCTLVNEAMGVLSPLLVRYEDLCQNPDEVQQEIANYFGLKIKYPFSQGHLHYRRMEEDEHVGAMRGGYGKDPLRPIDTTSVGTWVEHKSKEIAIEFSNIPAIKAFLSRFYENRNS